MIARGGFVSNSSSSSFVVYKGLLTDEQVTGIKQFYARMREEYDDCFGDSYKTFTDDGKYLMGETYYINKEFILIMDELGIDINDFYWEF